MTARFYKIFQTLKNNWKKSIFFSGVAAFGINYGKKRYDEEVLRRELALEAVQYGNLPIRMGEKPLKITVFLNPSANKGKVRKLFEKNVAPFLHLAGFEVAIVKTEYEGQAKKYMDVLENTDLVLVAGGDGTLQEVVTGLLKRKDADTYTQRVPIGVLPLGQTNTFAGYLFGNQEKEIVRWITDATMAIVRGATKPIDVLHIKGGEDKNVYALSGLEWGKIRDTEDRLKKNWYWGKLKPYWTYLRASLSNWPPLVEADMEYTNPCSGCNNCRKPPTWKWWHILMSPKEKDYSKTVNEDCGVSHSYPISGIQFTVRSSNLYNSQDNKKIEISQKPYLSRGEFIKHGFNHGGRRPYNQPESEQLVEAASFKLSPKDSIKTQFVDGVEEKINDNWFFIDNERFEPMPIEVSILPNRLHVFCRHPNVS